MISEKKARSLTWWAMASTLPLLKPQPAGEILREVGSRLQAIADDPGRVNEVLRAYRLYTRSMVLFLAAIVVTGGAFQSTRAFILEPRGLTWSPLAQIAYFALMFSYLGAFALTYHFVIRPKGEHA